MFIKNFIKTNSLGTGSIFIFIAKTYWLIMGYVLVLILPRIVSVETYGLWGVVIGIISVLNMVVIMGTNQGVSKFVSADKEHSNQIRTLAFKIQIFLGGGLAIIFFLSTGIISHFLNDPSLVKYFRIAVLITLSYSFYAVNVGYLNGLRKFKYQALLDMTFVTLKVIFVLGLALFGIKVLGQNGLQGAIGGFAIAAFIILIVSFFFTGFKLDFSSIKYKITDILSFIIWIMIFAFILNLLMSTDLFLVKKLISSDISTANLQTGYYTAAVTVSRIPYSFMMAVAIIIFPLISKVTSINDAETTKRYINNTLRFSFIFLIGIVGIISFNSTELISFILGAKYSLGGEPLRILSFAVLFLSMFTICNYIIMGAGKPKFSILFGFITLVLDIILNYFLIPVFGLKGAALSVLISVSIGLILTLIFLKKNFGTMIHYITIIKTVIALIIIYFISKLLGETTNLLIMGKAIFLYILFFLLLILFREIEKKDILIIKEQFHGKNKTLQNNHN